MIISMVLSNGQCLVDRWISNAADSRRCMYLLVSKVLDDDTE